MQPLVQTAVSSSFRIDDVYVNVWTSMPGLEQLKAVADGERAMPVGYRSLEIILRMDRMRFESGVREAFSKQAAEFAGKPVKNIMVSRAGGFGGSVIHGLVGILNTVGLKTPLFVDVDAGIAALLEGARPPTPAPELLRILVDQLIAEHTLRVPPPR